MKISNTQHMTVDGQIKNNPTRRIDNQPVVEAKEWFKKLKGKEWWFATNADGNDWIEDMVKTLYRLGVEKVYIGLIEESNGKIRANDADTLFVELPQQNHPAREKIIIVLAQANADEFWALRGNKNIFRLWWD